MKDYIKFKEIVKVLVTSLTVLRKCLLRHCDDDFIKFIGNTAINVLNGVVNISNYYVVKLDPAIVRKLGSRKIKKAHRRRLCVKHSDVVVILLKATYHKLPKLIDHK